MGPYERRVMSEEPLRASKSAGLFFHPSKAAPGRVFLIISGSGVIQWKNADGIIEEEKVGPGDAMFMPDPSVEHQLFNNGTEKMVVVYCGCEKGTLLNSINIYYSALATLDDYRAVGYPRLIGG